MRAIGSDPPCYPRQPSNPHACRDHPREPLVKKTILLYGLLGGVLIAVLKMVEYRYLVLEHSLELYGGVVAPPPRATGREGGPGPGGGAGAGARGRVVRAQRSAPARAGDHAPRARDPRGAGRGPEQQGDRRPAVREREYGQDPRGSGVRQAGRTPAHAGRTAREGGRNHRLNG